MTEPEVVHSDLMNPEYLAWGHFLQNSEGWTRRQIEEYQLSEIKRILMYAYQNTKGYKSRFDEIGIHLGDIRNLDDFHRIPFVEKEMIRDSLEEFSASVDDRNYITTGGSTGIPFGFYRDAKSFPRELASKAHQYHRIGWNEGDRQIVFRGLPIDTPDHTVFEAKFNELRCSSYHLTPEWMEVYRQKAWEYKPDWVRCYPSSGYILARWIKDNGRAFPPLKGVLCASENLYNFQRQLLSEVFGTRVFTHYGHYELAVLAGFCEYADTYHVLPQYGFAELIDASGKPVTEPGKMGEIVATSFIMHATPFVRYRTRDFAVLKGWGCPECGRPYQIWERVEGRLQEFVVTGTGRYISMTAINFHDDIFDHIKQFQFYQEAKGRVTFRYMPKSTCNTDVLDEIGKRLLKKLGDDVALNYERVDDIPKTKRGKHRFLIQMLPVEFHDR